MREEIDEVGFNVVLIHCCVIQEMEQAFKNSLLPRRTLTMITFVQLMLSLVFGRLGAWVHHEVVELKSKIKALHECAV